MIFSLVFSLIAFTSAGPVSASVLWFDSAVDTDSDLGAGLYADIDRLVMGTYSDDPDNLLFLMKPYYDTDLYFFSSGSGALSFDTNLDGVDDFRAFAPRTSLSAFSDSSRQMSNGAGSPINCFSQWSLTSDYVYYAISIPWRCLGMPSQFRVEAWLSNSFGYDFLNISYLTGPTYYPIFPAQSTTTTTTVYIPPTTAPAPPAPLVAPVNTSTPGMIDNWIKYLVINNSVSISAVLNTTKCCYGVKKGTRTMTVLRNSKGSCVVRGKRLYALKKGTCHVRISVKQGNKTRTETLKLRVRTK